MGMAWRILQQLENFPGITVSCMLHLQAEDAYSMCMLFSIGIQILRKFQLVWLCDANKTFKNNSTQ